MHAGRVDYIEAQLVSMKLDEAAAFAAAKTQVRVLPLPALAMCYRFPRDVRIVGPGMRRESDRPRQCRRLLLAPRASRRLSFAAFSAPDGADHVHPHLRRT